MIIIKRAFSRVIIILTYIKTDLMKKTHINYLLYSNNTVGMNTANKILCYI